MKALRVLSSRLPNDKSQITTAAEKAAVAWLQSHPNETCSFASALQKIAAKRKNIFLKNT